MGGVVGAVLALGGIASLAWWLRRRRAKRSPSDSLVPTVSEPFVATSGVELPDRAVSELSNQAQIKPELEVDSSGTRHELRAGSVRRRAGSPIELP